MIGAPNGVTTARAHPRVPKARVTRLKACKSELLFHHVMDVGPYALVLFLLILLSKLEITRTLHSQPKAQ